MKRFSIPVLIFGIILCLFFIANAVDLIPSVKNDPLIRMPGTQPDQGVNLEGPNRCLNCHGGYNQAVEPGFNWKGSMMAQASRDPLFWACLTVAGQDSVWAIGTPNAVDICERCHFPEGWLGGRSEPPNASAMTGSDFDGLHCDFCHTMWDPFFETTYNGTREGNDWLGYWDEATTLSQTEADITYIEDTTLAQGISLFNGNPFFNGKVPFSTNYTESATGQYFVSTNSQKRASFADAAARHQMLYSRYNKSKFFCSTCHDVSNPVLANLNDKVTEPLTTEKESAFSYFHVERTWSEFMCSDYGQQGGATTNPEFQAQGAPDITLAAKCQDCHMRDVVGVGCNKNGVPLRPDESVAHPNSGLPLHDMTGGNLWISHILASLDVNGPVYDPENLRILDKGPAVLTLDLNQGESPKVNGAALKAGSDRAKQQLLLAATIKNLTYDAVTGLLTFNIQNNSAHKLISGFPEGRRMFVNIRASSAGSLIYEVNPYDYNKFGTLKGLPHSHNSPPLGLNEVYIDELVYEVHPSSSLTGEEETFHFVLADGRYKDNRIPPKGFNVTEAERRLCEPVWHGLSAPNYFTADEYEGGYDDISLTIAPGADYVEVTLYYQGTSREYIEFLRDEINADKNLTLPSTPGTPGGDPSNYIIQTDPFFAQLAAWGNVIWDLWEHNHGLGATQPAQGRSVDGIVPFMMTQATVGVGGCMAPTPTLLTATPVDKQVIITWQEIPGDPDIIGYRLYYDQSGKAQLIADLPVPANTYTDTGLTNSQEYCYKVTSYYSADCESGFSNILCATPNNQGQTTDPAGVDNMVTGFYSGGGKNKTFIEPDPPTFQAGDSIVIRAYVIDNVTGLPLANATVDIAIDGPEVTTLTSGPSNANGIAEATWNTQSPNKKGQGGTIPGAYTAATTDVKASGYHWDSVTTGTSFVIQ
jgi:hypothetical protein